MRALIHISREGERWDAIAWGYYRDVRQMTRLIEANPHLAAHPVLPGGQKLMVPLITRDPAALDPRRLPPWRR